MGAVSALNMRAKVNPDSIDYFPNDVSRGCALLFFSDDAGRTLASRARRSVEGTR